MPAARVTDVGAEFAEGAFAAVFSKFIMRPRLAFSIAGHTSLVSLTAASSLRSMSSCQSSSVAARNGLADAFPALLINMSMLPKRETASAWVT